MKVVFKYILTMIILILMYNLLLYGISLFPSEWIYDNCLKSAELLMEEGGVYSIKPSFFCVDNFSDALIFNEAYSIDCNTPLESYLKARKNYNKEITEYELPDSTRELSSYRDNTIINGIPQADEIYDTPEELLLFLKGNVKTSVDYARYYHGYLVLYRPLLLLFDAMGIKVIQLLIFLTLTILLAYKIYKKMGIRITFSIIVSLVLFDGIAISYSLQQAPLFLVVLITCIVVVHNLEKITWKKMFYGSMIVGSIACFVDYLTIPVLTLALPLLIYSIYHLKTEKHVDNKNMFKNIFITCILWAFGYGITWLSKWIICDIFANTTVIQSAIEQIKFRSIGTVDRDLTNHFIVFLKYFAYVFLVCQILILILSELNKKRPHIKNQEPIENHTSLLLFISIVPLIWFLVTLNHSILHIFMTYRNFLPLCILGLLLFFREFTFKKKQ